MKLSQHKWFMPALSLALTASMFAGCSGGSKAGNSETGQSPPAGSPNSSSTAKAAPTPISFWMGMNPNATVTIKSMNEIAAVQEWEKRSNIKINFQHPAAGAEGEQYNVMLASNNLPDVICNLFGFMPGGYQKLYNDGTIIKLNDLIDNYAPNLKKILEQNPEVVKQLKSDNGDIYGIPHLQLGKYKVFGGMIIRQDWLDELGLKAPETIDEWETVLRAFKEKKGAQIPLLYAAPPKLVLIGSGAPSFIEAFGVTTSMFLDNGTVKYGPIENGYKEFLATFQRWYKEGLIDPDFAANDSKTYDAKVTSGKAGAFFGNIGAGIGRWMPALQQSDPKAKLAAVQFPVLKKGDQPLFTGRSWEWSGFGAVITKANKHPEETVKALDYFFSPEGHMLKNFGIEGQTYTMKDGQPVYTDLILNNPDKLTIAQALAKYMIANYPFAGMSDDRVNDQYYQLQSQKDAVKLYAKYADNTLKVAIPPVNLTSEEAKEFSKIMNDADTYKNEMFVKFIMGTEPLSNFDKFTTQVKKFNIEKAIQIEQDALNRYKSR